VCFLGSQKYTEVDLATQEAENPNSKLEKFPSGFFWVLSKESKAKRAEFSGQFFGTFQQVSRCSRGCSAQKAENQKSKSEKFPSGFFWVLSKESKAKRTEFSGQFLGTFHQAEIQQI